ncbi:MAG TPA: SHOCT domain-containing protein [Solirubrobacteraceae bacterium]|jgi:hypothetical protein
MVLLSGMMRAAAFTGSRQPIDDWFAGRQWGRWGVQHTHTYSPPSGTQRPADPAETLRSITELHERGVIDDAEFERLRARLRV